MTDLWEIARYVEKNPTDLSQRWRLAKKLYSAWEYRLALENLLILKNEWKHNLNILRYLAATYYRLGRYEDAIVELKEALIIWPNEVGLYEQLARVLEVNGHRSEAAQVWEDVHKIVPNHPFARIAMKRLREQPGDTSSEDLHLADSDTGIDLRLGRICTHCGAQNNDAQARCWQCHANLPSISKLNNPLDEPDQIEDNSYPAKEDLNLIWGLLVVSLISTGIYLSLILLLNMGNISQGETFQNFWELYRSNLAITRVVTGVVAILIWPIVLLLVARLIQPKGCKLSTERVLFTGLVFGLMAFLCTWLPGKTILLSVAAPATLSLLIIAFFYGLGLARTLVVWSVHLVIVGAIVVTTFFTSESILLGRTFNPFRELSAIASFLQTAPDLRARSWPLEGEILPLRQKILWNSTGSEWLDARINLVKINLSTNIISRDLKFELRDSSGTQLFEFIRGLQWTHLHTVVPGETYTVISDGTPGNGINITVTGMLIHTFLPFEESGIIDTNIPGESRQNQGDAR